MVGWWKVYGSLVCTARLSQTLRLINKNPFISNKTLIKKAGLTYSIRTLTRELIQRGIQHQRTLRKPKLSEKLIEKRLAFAKLYVRKPLN